MGPNLHDDLQHAYRRAVRTPFFTLANVLLLAASIGVVCTTFAVLDSLVLRRLPVADPDQLVLVSGVGSGPRLRLTPPMFDLLSQERTQLTHAFAFVSTVISGAIDDAPRRFDTFGVSGDYFQALGGRAVVGRLLAAKEEDGAVISYRLWQTHFAGDPSVTSKALTLGATSIPVIGVASPEFRATSLHRNWDVIVPLVQLNRASGSAAPSLQPIEIGARLRPGVAAWTYEAQLNVLWPELLRATLPAGRSMDTWREQRGERVRVQSLGRGLTYAMETRPGLERAVMLVFGLGALIFAGTCLTVALLAVTRGVRHQHHTTIMRAVGATEGRVVRTYLFEGVMLATAGSAGGLVVASWLNRAAAAFLPYGADLDWSVRVTAGVIAASAAMGLVAAVIIGLTPALVAGRSALSHLVQAGNRAAQPHVALRVGLLVIQVGLAVLIIQFSLVFARDLRAVAQVDVGFAPENLHVYSLTARAPQRPLDVDYFRSLQARVQAIPGVQSAALTGTLPPLAFVADSSQTVRSGDGRQTQAVSACIFPGYFETLQLPLLSGGDVTWQGQPSAVITRALAQALFPGADPIGQTVQAARTPPLRVVGVAADVAYNGPRRGHTPVVFVPCLQQTNPWPSTFVVEVLVRSERSLADLESDVRTEVSQAGPQFVYRSADSSDHLARSIQSELVVASVASVFAAITVLLTGFGLYAFSSYVSALRTKDLAIRASLGAQPGQISTVLAREVTIIVIGGSTAGAVAALAAGRALSGVVQGVDAVAAGELALSVLIASTMAAVAVVVPMRRGTRLDLARVLRVD